MAPILDTSGNWREGDNYKVLQVLGLPMSEYMVSGITTCCNAMDDALVARVVVDLDRYDAAKAVQTAADLANPEDKMLTKADVLEWQAGRGTAGITRELDDVRESVRLAFGSCPYVPQGGAGGVTVLYRS